MTDGAAAHGLADTRIRRPTSVVAQMSSRWHRTHRLPPDRHAAVDARTCSQPRWHSQSNEGGVVQSPELTACDRRHLDANGRTSFDGVLPILRFSEIPIDRVVVLGSPPTCQFSGSQRPRRDPNRRSDRKRLADARASACGHMPFSPNTRDRRHRATSMMDETALPRTKA